MFAQLNIKSIYRVIGVIFENQVLFTIQNLNRKNRACGCGNIVESLCVRTLLSVMSSTCGKCEDSISPGIARALCANCKKELHLNNTCSGLKPQTWNSKGASSQASWVCPECSLQAGLHKKMPTVKEINNNDDEDRVSQLSILQFMQKIDSKLERLEPIQAEVVKLNSAVLNIQEDNLVIKDELEKAKDRVTSLEYSNNLLQEKVEELSKKLNTRQEYANGNEVNKKLEDIEQYSRRNELIFNGIPEIGRETPLSTVFRIGRLIGYELEAWQIDDCHRLPRRNKESNAVSPFIIRFVNRYIKRDVLIYSKRNRIPNIYENEHLTPAAVELKKKATSALKEKGFRMIHETVVSLQNILVLNNGLRYPQRKILQEYCCRPQAQQMVCRK